MARASVDGLVLQNNSKLDSFLKRNTSREVYERIRVCEPCVVVSGSVKKVFMHVILSDERVYLCEYQPRALREAFCFKHVTSIDLINDLPDFLSGQHRERSLHIRIVHTTKRDGRKTKGSCQNKSGCSSPSPSQSHHGKIQHSLDGADHVFLSTLSSSSNSSGWRTSDEVQEEEEGSLSRKRRSASCPQADVMHRGLYPLRAGASVRRGSVVAIDFRPVKTDSVEKKQEELHLYAVSSSSRIYLHLQTCWSSYIIKSTLKLDPGYRKICGIVSAFPQKSGFQKISWERTCQLFNQLSGELLQENISLENMYLLLQELHTSTYRNPTIRKLFWRSPDLYPFLVKTLSENTQDGQDGVHTADRLLLCTLVVQILSLMFHDTDTEPARLGMLTARQGALTAAMLISVMRDTDLQLLNAFHCTSSVNTMQGLQSDYMDAASALLYEVVVLCQEASRTPSLGHFLTVGWVFRLLKPHSFFLPFVGHQAQQVVQVLSGTQTPLSPTQAVLLYQRCRVVLVCLQHSNHLSKYIRTGFKEEFRYYVKMSGLQLKLPSHYPISQPAQHVISQLLSLILQEP